MNKTVINLVIALKVLYVILIVAVIANKLGGFLEKYEDRVVKIKSNVSTLYTFIMALVLFNLFRPAKGPRLVHGEEKNMLFLFGFILCLEIILSVIKGEAF